MTKSELVSAVASKFELLSVKEMEVVVDVVFDSIVQALIRDERTEIRGFGAFSSKKRVAREGRNPKTGGSVQVPAKRTPFFIVGKELKERVNKKYA